MQRGDQPIPGRAEFGHDHMPGLLAAQITPGLAHLLTHIAVTDSGAQQAKPARRQEALKPHIGHDSGDHGAAGQAGLRMPRMGDQRQDLVAINHLPGLIHQHHTIGIAIQGNAQIGAAFLHQSRKRCGRGGAHTLVNIEAIRGDADGDHLGAQFPQHGGGHAISGAMGAIHNNAQPI